GLTFASLMAFGPMPAAAAGDPVVATVGDHKITDQELDAKVKSQLASIQNKIYDLKVQAIHQMADEYLVTDAAKKEHLSVEAYLDKHSKLTKLTPADAKKYYDDHKELAARYPQYDKIKDQLLKEMQRESDNRARLAVIEELRKEHPVKVMLTAPRVEVSTTG